MNRYSPFALDTADVIDPNTTADPSDWRLLRRLRLPDRFNDSQSGPIRRALVLDVETTGLSTERDDVIQLAMLPFDYRQCFAGCVPTATKPESASSPVATWGIPGVCFATPQPVCH